MAAGEITRFETEHLFVMIEADPCTAWLRECVDLDSSGFVRTSFGSEERRLFETSVPGIFAVGDVRSGSVKRVTSAVGEGSVVVAAIHRHLKLSRLCLTALTRFLPGWHFNQSSTEDFGIHRICSGTNHCNARRCQGGHTKRKPIRCP